MKPRSTRRVPLSRKLTGLLLGTVASLASLEALLWVLAGLLAPEGRAGIELEPGTRRIVCLGDSNTYGINLEAEQSYPGRLQSYLDRAPDNPWRVINLGHPGQNTAQMRGRLAENLEAYRPEILVLWGGVNNKWSPAMDHLWEHPDSEPAGERSSLLSHSRAYKALRMMTSGAGGELLAGAPEAEERPMERAGDEQVPGLGGALRGEGLGKVEIVHSTDDRVNYKKDEVREHITTDLRRIRAICEEYGVRLVLGEYWAEYEWVDDQINAPIADFAREHGVPVVPLCDRIREVTEAFGQRIRLGDGHASEVGNLEVARLVLLALIEAGMLEARDEWLSVPPLEDVLELPFMQLLERDGQRLELELIGPSRENFRVNYDALLRRKPDEPPEAVRLHPAHRKLFEPALTTTARTRLYGSGRLTVELPTALPEELPERFAGELVGWRLSVTCADPEAEDGDTQARVHSKPIDVPLGAQ